MSTPTVGVLALQGAFARHVDALRACGADAIEVRSTAELASVDALVIPGGESTTISKLLVSNGLDDLLGERLAAGLPTFGTCAGMILLATDVLDGRPDQLSFAAIDLSVRRNAYGRQIDSFEADLDLGGGIVDGVDGAPFRAVFIRAPVVERVGDGVDVLASVDDRAVLCRSGSVLVSSFHPELTPDVRLHRHFVETMVSESVG